MKGINEGYSGLMTRLRIGIGLIATALLVGALPAHAGTTFRTAKVCAQTQSGIKITNVKFNWAFPGTVGGFGTTDTTGCFKVRFLPIGQVAFSNQIFSMPLPGASTFMYQNRIRMGQQIYYLAKTRTVNVRETSPVQLLFPDIGPLTKFAFKVQDLNGTQMSAYISLIALNKGHDCTAQGYLPDSFEDFRNFVFDSQDYADRSIAIPPLGRMDQYPDHMFNSIFVKAMDFKLFTIGLQTSQICIVARFPLGQNPNATEFTTVAIPFLSPTTKVVYPGYVEAFIGLPVSLSTKSGKVTLTTTLHDDQNQPVSETPVTVSESKASNPNISKTVGSCRPVLTAITNAQGKAKFTLCPTKNTTVTVKAPLLGIVSQSIAVTK